MKKNMKKILAFLCAVVLFVTAVFTENAMNQAQAETETSTQATSTEPTPVELYGFENVTLNDFQNATMEEKEYTVNDSRDFTLNGTNFNKKLFTAWVKFTNPEPTAWYKNAIYIGSTSSNWGLAVGAYNDDLKIGELRQNVDNNTDVEYTKDVTHTAANVSSFLNNEFLLQVGYEYGDFDNDNSGVEDDVRVLVYVNGKEVLKDIIYNCNLGGLGNMVRFYLEGECTVQVRGIDLPVKPVKLDGFTNVTVEDFTYVTGGAMSEKEHTWGVNNTCYLTNATDFDKKLFTANVKFSYNSGVPGYFTRIHVGGNGQYTGLAVYTNETGTELTIKEMNSGTSALATFSETVSNTTAGVTSFLEFLLQMGYEYLDTNSDGAYDAVRVLVYADGNNILDKTIKNCNMSVLGNYLGLNCEDSSSKIGISKFQSEVKPVTLSSHDTVTISDFQDSAGKEMEAKGYDYDGTTPSFSLKDESADYTEKLLSMKVKFGYRDGVTPSYETRMEIPASDGSGGIWIYADNAGLHIDDTNGEVHRDTVTCADADVSSFINTPFILQMNLTDTTDGLKVGVYINGSLSKEFPWNYAGEKVNVYSAKLNLNRGVENSFITVSDVDADEFPADPAIMPDSTFERITFGSFGIVDGTYSEIAEKSISAESLHQKVLCGKVKFDLSQWFTFRLGGTSEWCGLYLSQDGATNIAVKWVQADLSTPAAITDIEGNILTSFTTDDAEIDLLGNEYNLMISMESTDVNNDGTSDVKFGVWFANKLYKDQYYYVLGQGDSLGNKFGINSDGTSEITLNSVAEYLPQPDEKYDKVTFQHFLVEDGEYESKGVDWIFKNSFKKKEDLDKIIVCGDVLLNGGTSEYMFALGEKESNPENGILLWINNDLMTLNIKNNATAQAVITSSKVGMGNSFVGKQFSLMWSVEFVDSDTDNQKNDVKVQLWFNGVLCADKTFKDVGTAEELGNTFSVCCRGTGDSITLNSASELIPQPDESLQKLSLPDFVHNGTTEIMESGTFSSKKTGEDWYVSGNAKDHKTLDGKVVSFDILQSGTAGTSSYQMRLGGKTTNHWTGLVLNTASDGTMDINWSKSDNTMAIGWQDVDMTQAAASNFLNETFNLMVSMELVDADGNGTSDIKVRIWFNKILYVHGGQDSIIFYDIGSELGNTLAILCSDNTNKAFVSLRTDAEYQSNPYYYEDITEYRHSTGYEAPSAPEGYVFSGWYEDEDYKTALTRETVSGPAYAKFAENDVLKVKAQVGLGEDGKVPTTGASLRFVTTLDSLEYRKIAFKIRLGNDDFATEYDSYNLSADKNLAKKVYRNLYYVGQDEGELAYKPNAFSWMSEYFKAWSLTGISSNSYDTIIRVTPYWITMDGTTVKGEQRDICVNDYDADAYEKTSSAVTMHFLGQNTMPIAGYGIWNSKDEDDSLLFPNYTSEEYFKMFADAGINLVNYSSTDYTYNPTDVLKQLDYGGKYGVGMFVTDEAVRKATDSSAIAERINNSDYSKKDAFCGIFLVDEPGGTYFKSNADNGKISAYTNQAGALTSLWETLNTQLGDGNKYVTYSNMFPVRDASDTTVLDKLKYKSYVNEFAEELNPGVLSWDYYPFEENKKTNGEYDMSEYFWNMDLIRNTAVNSGKPFWAYVQAGSQWKGSLTEGKFTTPYYPTESQFKWNVNTSLAFGAQGIQYYPLIQPMQHAYDGESAEYDFEVNGIISAWGGKTPWYYYAQEINKQIAAIDEVLMNAKTEKVVVPTSGDARTDTSDLDSVATSYGKLSSVSGDAMVGYFNYGGKVALYVVNYEMFDVGESATSQNVTLTFTEDYSKIKKIEDATTTKVATSSKKLTLSMEAGEGILLVLE